MNQRLHLAAAWVALKHPEKYRLMIREDIMDPLLMEEIPNMVGQFVMLKQRAGCTIPEFDPPELNNLFNDLWCYVLAPHLEISCAKQIPAYDVDWMEVQGGKKLTLHRGLLVTEDEPREET